MIKYISLFIILIISQNSYSIDLKIKPYTTLSPLSKNACQKLKNKDLKKVTFENLKKYKNIKPTMTLISEYHGSRYQRLNPQHYRLFKELNNEINCNFVELPEDFDVSKHLYEFIDDMPIGYFTYDYYHYFYTPLINSVSRKGGMSFYVDADFEFRISRLQANAPEGDTKAFEYRDKNMFRIIQEKMSGPRCTAGFMSVGELHFTQGHTFNDGLYYTSLGSMLKDKYKEKVQLVSIQYPGNVYECLGKEDSFILNQKEYEELFGATTGYLSDLILFYDHKNIDPSIEASILNSLTIKL